MKRSLLFYYILLLGAISTWNSPELPPMVYRVAFLVLAIVPILFSNARLFPCILSTFVLISANRHVPSFMPFLPEYLLITTLGALFVKRYKSGVKAPKLLLLFILFTFLVDALKSFSIESISISALMVFLFYFFVDSDVDARCRELSISLVVISAFLCIETFLFRGQFTHSLSVGDVDYERVGWNDPNYFSMVVGMGFIASLNILLSPNKVRKQVQVLLFGVIMLIIVVLLMVASRGGIVALFLSAATLLFLSQRRSRTSTGMVILLVAFIAVLYEFGAFDFLLSRFTNDEGAIGGRKIIWLSKLNDFAAQASPLEWLFGMGQERGLALASYLGNRDLIGFHNDFIAIFVSYGLVGLLMMITLYLFPIIKYKDPRVTAGCLYIILISMSLEPLYSGALSVFYFYFYVCILGDSTLMNTSKEFGPSYV